MGYETGMKRVHPRGCFIPLHVGTEPYTVLREGFLQSGFWVNIWWIFACCACQCSPSCFGPTICHLVFTHAAASYPSMLALRHACSQKKIVGLPPRERALCECVLNLSNKYIYIYIYMCVIDVCVHVHIWAYIYIYICIHTHTYKHVYIQYIYIYMYMHTYRQTDIHTLHTHIHTYTHTYAHCTW